MALADNHIHFLLGVDDGAKDEEVKVPPDKKTSWGKRETV